MHILNWFIAKWRNITGQEMKIEAILFQSGVSSITK